jgi:hypothetical protein
MPTRHPRQRRRSTDFLHRETVRRTSRRPQRRAWCDAAFVPRRRLRRSCAADQRDKSVLLFDNFQATAARLCL